MSPSQVSPPEPPSGVLRWGIVGLGVAGRARARAIASDPRALTVAVFRGQVEQTGPYRAETFAQLLSMVDAVAICSPDVTHPDLVREALGAGRHVVCEFPLAGTAKVARELLGIARRRGRVLHVEHIELLDGPCRVLRELARGWPLQGGALSFVGARRRGIYGVAHANLARLSRLVDAVGLPEAVRVDMRGPRFLKGALLFPGGAVVRLDFRQDDDQPRRTELLLDGDQGPLRQCDQRVWRGEQELAVPPVPGLFLQDQLVASARILDGISSYISDERIVDLISLADALVRSSPGGGWLPFVPGSTLAPEDEIEPGLADGEDAD